MWFLLSHMWRQRRALKQRVGAQVHAHARARPVAIHDAAQLAQVRGEKVLLRLLWGDQLLLYSAAAFAIHKRGHMRSIHRHLYRYICVLYAWHVRTYG